MLVRDAYNSNTVKIKAGSTLQDVAELFAETRASDIMVVGNDDVLVGVASEGDLVREVLPGHDEILDSDLPLLAGFEMMEEKGQKLRNIKVEDIMVADPLTVREEDALIKAAQIMMSKMIRRLPVVRQGKLVGSLSRADICRAVLAENIDEL